MAVNAYLVIDGIEGPSTSKKKAIDLLSFSIGASMPVNYQAGASGNESRAGRASVSDLSAMKVTDKTSPQLFEACVLGTVIPKVEVIYDKPTGAAGNEQSDYFKIEMEDVVLSSYQVSGSSENPTESLSFAPQKIKVYYNPEDDDGKLSGFVDRGFDTALLKKY